MSADKLHVILERMPPGTHELRHVHQATHQFYFVLEGEAAVEIDGFPVAVSASEGIAIPPGTVHQLRNDSGRSLEFLVASSGPPREDRVDLA